MNDDQVEHSIQRAGIDAPRVMPNYINHLLTLVEYVMVQPEGTTTTLCLAYMPGKNGMKFLLAQGTSACVSPELFNAQIGEGIAKSKAAAAAKDKLWELEGYILFQHLNRMHKDVEADSGQ